MYDIFRRKPRAQSLINYAIILAVVSSAILAMSTYVKRGLQGRIRDMTDDLIADEQLCQVDEADSVVTTDIWSWTRRDDLTGGRFRLAYGEVKDEHAESEVISADHPYARHPLYVFYRWWWSIIYNPW